MTEETLEEQNIPTNNPAGRLYEILTKAIEIGRLVPSRRGTNTEFPSERRVFVVLAKALEIDNPDSFELFDGIAKLSALVNDTELAINKTQDVNIELYLRAINEVKEAFNNLHVNLPEDWLLIANKIDKSTLEKLEFCADVLSRQQGEIVLNNEELNELFDEVRTLLEKVLDADLDKDIKSFMLEKLKDIDQAIINYKFQGSKGLIQAIESTLGATIINEKIRSQKEKPIVTNFFTVIGRVASVLNVYNNTKNLAPDVGKMLQYLLPGAKDI
ncbi:MAG: hypothetical protein WBG73_15360 [Coleofasciculaceae cyanobacterium]